MAYEYYKSKHTGQQIDDAVDAVGNKADVTNIGGAKKLDLTQFPILGLMSVEQIADTNGENNKMWWSTDGGKLKYKQSGQIYVLAETPPYMLYYCGETIYKWDGKGFTAMSSGGGSSDYPPAGGIPATDLAGDIPASKLSSAVQTSLYKANSAYQKPSTGIPSTDLAGGITNAQLAGSISYTKLAGSIPATKLASAVQTTLGKAESAVQPTALTDLFASIVYDSTTNRFNFYGKGDTSHTTPLAYIEASQLGGIADNLDTNDASMGLSAKQGYILRTAIDTLATALANLAFNGEKPTMPWDEQSVPEGDISNYVQDGLVFHLDGIDKGNVADQWTDLIGGVAFPNHGATALDNCWQLGGDSQYLGVSQKTGADLTFSPQNCTIEFVYQNNSSDPSMIAHLGKQNSNILTCIYVNPNSNGWINGVYVDGSGTQNQDGTWTNGHVYAYPKDKATDKLPHTISLNKTRAFADGIQLSSSGANHWGGNGGGRYIGCASSYSGSNVPTPQYFANGKVYAIRIYNRILTQEEMLNNQRVDNARFELGLTLPE